MLSHCRRSQVDKVPYAYFFFYFSDLFDFHFFSLFFSFCLVSLPTLSFVFSFSPFSISPISILSCTLSYYFVLAHPILFFILFFNLVWCSYGCMVSAGETGLGVSSCCGGRDCQYARRHILDRLLGTTSWHVEKSTLYLEYFYSVPAPNAYRPNAQDFSQ